MYLGDAREILAHNLHGIHTTERQMPGVGGEPYVVGIRELHHPMDIMLAFHGTPDMRMRSHPDAHGNCLPADLVERAGQSLQLVVARPARRPVPHVAFPDRDAE